MRIATVIGARPQFIKAAMISMEINKYDNIDEIIIHTGQHFDSNMSNIFFEEMGIPEPDYNLGIQSLAHGAMTGRQLEEIEKVLVSEKPDWVLVYGDTNSTLAGALAASKLHIPIAHVEAGLRSFNKKMPEEINRILTDHLAKLLFVPTETAKTNLIKEGIDLHNIKLVGDVMYDASIHFIKIAEKKSNILDKLGLNPKEYILTTIHRQENTNNSEKLKDIIFALAEAPKPVIFPLHPRTKKKLRENKIKLSGKLKAIEPLGYLDMIMLEKNAWKIATDSGGIQKEAYFFKVPCLTLRNETEWVETVDAGWNYITGVKSSSILEGLRSFKSPFETKDLFFGDGQASSKILNYLC